MYSKRLKNFLKHSICRNVLVGTIFTVVYGCCLNDLGYEREFKEEDDRLVKVKCYSCHAPNDTLTGPPLKYLYHKDSTEDLKKYLTEQFLDRGQPIVEHEGIKLNKRQVVSIYTALKYYAPLSRK